MSASTVRISPKSQMLLKDLAHQDGKTMSELLDLLIEQERRRRLFESADAAYKALRNDPLAWKEELAERALWEGTLADGVDKDEIWNEDGSVK